MRAALLAVALVLLVAGQPLAVADDARLTIDPPNVIPPVADRLSLPFGFDWAFDGVVCREASTAKLLLSAQTSGGVVADLQPAIIEIEIAAHTAPATLSGHATSDLLLVARSAGAGSVTVAASLALPDGCLVVTGPRSASDSTRIPLELRASAGALDGPTEASVSQLRVVELTPHRYVPGPLLALGVALIGTAVIEIARRLVRATRGRTPAA
jgi:hypothetical protein